VVDVGSGQVIAEVDTGGHLATQPDWSPDGTQIVWTSYEVEGPAQLMQFHGGGDLWVTPIDPVTLVSGRPFRVLDLTPPARAAYPSYSPDGTWLLYNRSDEDSYDDYTARVWTVRSDGRGDPVDLGAASFDGSSPLSGPRWAPFGNTADGGEPIWWFTASTREPIGVGPWTFDPQLWMGAFFPGRPGARATSPLWHIPNQGDAHNHFGQWTTTLVEID
jgi:Tol biopolymer transport system component